MLQETVVGGFGGGGHRYGPGGGRYGERAARGGGESYDGLIYAITSSKDTVVAIDGASGAVTAIPVGKGPKAVAVNPVKNRAYVINEFSGTMSVIDGATNRVSATVDVGPLPSSIALNPETNKIYVARSYGNGFITVVDGATNTPTQVKVGVEANAIAVNSKSNKIYLVGYEDHSVTVVDGATDTSSKVPAGTHLWEIAVDPARNRIYLPNSGDGRVDVIHDQSSSTVAAGSFPCAVALDPASDRAYVLNYGSDSYGGEYRKQHGDGDGAHGKTATGDRGEREDPSDLRGEYAQRNVTVIDGNTHTVVAVVAAGEGPYSIAVNAVTNKVYVANRLSRKVTVIDGETNRSSEL